jgi:hypothetical protein
MSFELYGDVILRRDLADHGLWADDVGTPVEQHRVPGVAEDGYSVEFFDMTGNTVAVPADALRVPTAADRPAVRATQRVITGMPISRAWFEGCRAVSTITGSGSNWPKSGPPTSLREVGQT